MKNCLKCGTQCEDTARFCTNCGAPFEMMRSPDQTERQQKGQTDAQTYPAESGQQNSGTQNQYGGWQQNGSAQDQYGGWQQNGSAQNQYGGWQQNSGTQNQYGGWQQNSGPQGQYGGYRQQGAYDAGNMPSYNAYGIRRRSIVLAIIFTLITFGIYGIYWMIKLNDEVNQLANEPEAASGGLVFLFSLITFGIYSYYWLYRMGERCDAIRGEWNGYKSILYLILGLVGLSIVSYALIQDVVNKSLPPQA